MARNDVAIYSPGAASLYERRPQPTGGAERQTTLLAGRLAAAGLRVAQIVLPVADHDPGRVGSVALVQRPLVTTERGPAVRLRQTRELISALAEADADVYVFRHSLPALGIAALFCRLKRRRLIFSASNNVDFTFDFFVGRRPERRLYELGVKGASTVVVQTDEQARLARASFPRLARVVVIPSFAESAPKSTARPEAFLWMGRLDHAKQPLRYLDLAESLPEARFWMVARRLEPERGSGAVGGVQIPGLEREALDRAERLPNVELLEQRPHAEAMSLIERAVAIVNTGPAEGMPNIFLEAWARGVPALSYEFDPDGRIARLGLGEFADSSPEHFREGARRLWERRGEREELSDRVRAYLESTHGLAAVTGAWLDAIAEVRQR